MAAADCKDPRRDHLRHRVQDARGIVTVADGVGQPAADTKAAFGLEQQQEAAVGRLVAALEIDCELLKGHGWQIEREGRILAHGCGAGRRYASTQADTGLLRESRALRHSLSPNCEA